MDDQANIPQHIGFILDGNRRWARSKGLPTLQGHKKGYDRTHEILKKAFSCGVKYVSMYVFSTENWDRSKEEIDYLMNLILRYFKKDVKILQKNNTRLLWAGTRDKVRKEILEAIEESEAATANNTGGTALICFNYGGHTEIVEATKKIIADNIDSKEITPELFSQYLYAPGVPPVDIIVRTSGEQRISNFMLWRAAYSELMFIDKTWPDVNEDDVDKIIEEYARRSRRFGK